MKRKSTCLKCAIIIIMCTMTCNITAQRVSLDSLDYTQLQHQMYKAGKMRKAGMEFVFAPLALGIIFGGHALVTYDPDDVYNPLRFYLLKNMAICSVPMMITGGIMWAVGSKRIDKIDIALKKYDLMPENPMALGVGITFNLRF